jgi:hypothetical protein
VAAAGASKERWAAEVCALRAALAERPEGGDQSLLTDYRRLLNCQVCNSRPKESAIVKCGHMFCGQCVRANLETRHRKCPSCGKAFGAEDVKPLYF